MNRSAHVRFTREVGLAHCIVAAAQSGLLQALLESDGPLDVHTATDLHPDGVDRVLGVLEAAGWVTHADAGWEICQWLRDAQMDGMRADRTLGVFRHAPKLLADGSTMIPGEVRHDARGVLGLARMFDARAIELAAMLPMASGTILDVGAGSAVWSLAMIGPEARVVALDRAEVLRAAQQRAAEQGKSEQLELLPGSFWDVDLPVVDRVVIANVVHLLSDEASRELVGKMKRALRPGGELVVIDVLGQDTNNLETASYALHLRLREPDGTVHRQKAIEGWLTDAGLQDVRVLRLSDFEMPLGAVVGTVER